MLVLYLSQILIKNFRNFGQAGQAILFNSGLTVLVGENDSGKTAILDAIRIVLGTTDQGWHRIELSDFHNEDMTKEISIVLKFNDLDENECGAFQECCTFEARQGANGSPALSVPCLYLHWKCRYLLNLVPPRTSVSLTTGLNGDGQTLPADAKELLRVTYLRALRDAYSDMQSGRSSRLSQILNSTGSLNSGVHEYVEGVPLNTLSITGIANLSNKLLAEHPELKKANQKIAGILADKLLLKTDSLMTKFEVSGTNSSETKKLIALLEKLDLAIENSSSSTHGKVGLGTSNILSMACEMLLNEESDNSSFLLIEEPEAHIHAQRQLKVIQSLQSEAANNKHQIILTTHSPLLASVVSLENVTVIKAGKAYPMKKGQTKLDSDDYLFLERYLDATKANLFFAKSVLIVEGPSEELLFPTIARIFGKSFTDYGVSIINARGTGLRRFAKIFQREDASSILPIKVACVADRDIMPDCAPVICINKDYTEPSKYPERRKWRTHSEVVADPGINVYMSNLRAKSDGQMVRTFISDHWTLEYDLAYAGLIDEMVDVLVTIRYQEANRDSGKKKIKKEIETLASNEEKAAYICSFFTDNSTSKGEFSQQLAFFLESKYAETPDELKKVLPTYIIEAINYVVS